MDRDTVIDKLRMTMDLFVFDPSTGEERDPDELNDLDRATYDACKGALEIIEQLPPNSTWEKVTHIRAYDVCGNVSWGVKRNCTNCGFTHIFIEDHGHYPYCPNCRAEMG